MQNRTEENKALVQRYWEEVWNQGKLELIEAFFSPEYVDLSETRSFIAGWRKACPDSRIVIDALIAEDDFVVTRYHCQGAVHTGVWEESLKGLSMAVPPTGKEIRDQGITIWRIADGKVVGDWGEWNELDVAQQLGVVPLSG